MTIVKRKRFRGKRGSSIVETAVGLLLLIPVALFLVDLVSIVLVQTANDQLAKQAARAAAETPDPGDGTAQGKAQGAAQQIVDAFPVSRLITNPQLLKCDYTNTANTSQVAVRTQVTCVLPVPLPFNAALSRFNFVAEATEPIVAVLSPDDGGAAAAAAS